MLHEHGLLRELAALRRYWLGGSAEFVEQLCGHLEAAAERGAPWRGGGTCRRALHQALLGLKTSDFGWLQNGKPPPLRKAATRLMRQRHEEPRSVTIMLAARAR